MSGNHQSVLCGGNNDFCGYLLQSYHVYGICIIFNTASMHVKYITSMYFKILSIRGESRKVKHSHQASVSAPVSKMYS